MFQGCYVHQKGFNIVGERNLFVACSLLSLKTEDRWGGTFQPLSALQLKACKKAQQFNHLQIFQLKACKKAI